MNISFGSAYRIYAHPQDVNKTVDLIKKDLTAKKVKFDVLDLNGEDADRYRHKTVGIFTNDKNGNDADLCGEIKDEFYSHFKIKAQADRDLAKQLPPNTILIGAEADKFEQKVYEETQKRIGEPSNAFKKFKAQFLDKFASKPMAQNAILIECLLGSNEFDTTTGEEKW